MSDSKSSAGRKRHRINIGFSPEEMAEIERRVPLGERAQWCRERILMSENFRDPVFDIGARLMAEAVSHKRLKAHLAKCEERLADVSNTLQLLGDDKRSSILERGARWHREKSRLVQLRLDIRARTYGTWAGGHFNAAVVASLERKTEERRMVDTWGARPDPAPGEARRHLDQLDRNLLQLAGSRASPWPRPDLAQDRFLDDPALLTHFAETPGALLQPELQKRLHAIEAIQIQERRWLAAALLQNRVAIENGELVTRRKEDAWAREFWHAQKSDPSFLRLIAVARLRPDRFGQLTARLDERRLIERLMPGDRSAGGPDETRPDETDADSKSSSEPKGDVAAPSDASSSDDETLLKIEDAHGHSFDIGKDAAG